MDTLFKKLRTESVALISEKGALIAERHDLITVRKELKEEQKKIKDDLDKARVEKLALIAEQTALKKEQQRIKADLAEAQDRVDHMVVQTKFVIFGARYALRHTEGMTLTRDDLRTVDRSASKLPEAERRLVQTLVSFYEIGTDMRDIALNDLREHGENLNKLPISPWARNVVANPDGGRHPNGTPYQPGVTPQGIDAGDTQPN